MSSSPTITRKCLCSPTSHPGSFRCHHHRARTPAKVSASEIQSQWEWMSPAAKANSVKAFLLHIIKPSTHDLHRRRDFKPRPSRFSRRHDTLAVS